MRIAYVSLVGAAVVALAPSFASAQQFRAQGGIGRFVSTNGTQPTAAVWLPTAPGTFVTQLPQYQGSWRVSVGAPGVTDPARNLWVINTTPSGTTQVPTGTTFRATRGLGSYTSQTGLAPQSVAWVSDGLGGFRPLTGDGRWRPEGSGLTHPTQNTWTRASLQDTPTATTFRARDGIGSFTSTTPGAQPQTAQWIQSSLIPLRFIPLDPGATGDWRPGTSLLTSPTQNVWQRGSPGDQVQFFSFRPQGQQGQQGQQFQFAQPQRQQFQFARPIRRGKESEYTPSNYTSPSPYTPSNYQPSGS